MKRIILFSTAFALVFSACMAFSTAAEARGHHAGGYHNGPAYAPGYAPGMPPPNPEQQAELQRLYNEMHVQAAPLHAQIAAKRAELQVQRVAPNPDMKRVQSILRDIADIETKLFELRFGLQKSTTAMGIAPYAPGMRGYAGHGYIGHDNGYGYRGHR